MLDNAIPLGYLEDFRNLEAPARRAVKRLQTYAASVSDSMASTALSALRRESEHRASLEKSIADQMVIAADMKPKRFRTKWQRAVYDGPTARKDAEASERDRWIHLLANLLRSTDTNGEVDQGEPVQHPVARGWTPCRNSQVKSSVCAEIPWLAYCFTRHQVSSTLEAADGVFASSVFGALCQRILEACPLLVHLLAGGGWDGGQAHGCCDVCYCVERDHVAGESWKASTPGAKVPDYFACGV